MVESPVQVPVGCWGADGAGGPRLRRQRQLPIQLEEEAVLGRAGGCAILDHFDRLPDPVLLLILNRIGDVKALGRCCAVSHRFHSLVSQVDNLLVRVDCVIPDEECDSPSAEASLSGASLDKPARGLLSHLARHLLGGIYRPLQAIGRILSIIPISAAAGGKDSLSSSSPIWIYRRKHPTPTPSSSSDSAATSNVSHHSPTEVLRNFRELERLRVELPAGELAVDDGSLLKWKANFGSTLNNCVILGASCVVPSSEAAVPTTTTTAPPLADKSAVGDANINAASDQLEDSSCGPDGHAGSPGGDDGGTMPESFYANGALKQRVMWTISSLIAASGRHHLLQSIVADHRTLENLDLVDADGQGVLRMDKRQLEELRAKPAPVASASSKRTLLPALDVRLWHAQQLKLSDGKVLQGATLVAIRPSEDQTTRGNKDMSWVAGAFEDEEDGEYGSAVRQLVKGRMYCLEMNSF